MNIEEIQAAYEAARADCNELNDKCTSAYIASVAAYNIYMKASARYNSALKLSLSLNEQLVKALETHITK